MNQDSNFLKYFSILLIWKRFIIINFVIISILAVGISLLLPNWYKATTTLLQPKQADVFSNLGSTGSLLRGITGISRLGNLGQKAGAYNYFALLRSRTVMEKVIAKFDLITIYETEDHSLEETIKELNRNVNFEEEEDDEISIEVFDKDPIRAADMANYFVEMLNEINTRLGTQEARNNKEFVELRLLEANKMLYRAEDSLRKFQEYTGLMITPEQTSGVDAIATLYSMKVKKEIEVAIMERSVTLDNNTLQQLKMELAELNKKVSTLPQTGIESIRLYREVAIQQKILEFLIPLYEQAKIDEQKNIPVLLILDRAVPAEKKIKPQRMLIVFLTSLLSLSLLVIISFLLHGFALRRNVSDPLSIRLNRFALSVGNLFKIHIM